MAETWIYRRIFINPSDKGPLADYASLLREIVNPAVTTFRPHIKHFHFFRYAGAYADHSEEVNDPLSVVPEERVHFVRLRILADEDQQPALDSLLSNLCANSAVCRGVEIPTMPFDIEADIGGRFGGTRTWPVADLIQAAAALALAYACDDQPYDPQPQGQGGASGLVHLVANTLFYQVNISIHFTDWERQNSGMIPLGP